MSRFKDFDAFYAEMKREPVTFKMFGETFNLPHSLPAIVMLEVINMSKKKKGSDELSHIEEIEMITKIIGEENFKRLCDKGLDIEQMGDLLQWMIEVYTGSEGDEGNEEAPKKGQK